MKKILVILIGLTVALAGFAKNSSTNDSYNMRRAQEEVENGNIESAIDYYNKELHDNPKNAYAYLAIASLKSDSKHLNDGLDAVNKGIKLLSNKDKDMLSSAYLLRGNIFLSIGDSVKAMDDYNLSLKFDSGNRSSYEKRGELLFDLGRTDESNADYNKLIELNPAGYMGYMGLGRNAKVSEDYPTAIKNFTKVIGLEPDYSSGYSFRAECYLKQEKFIQAADDIMKALTIDHDGMAHYLISQFPAEQMPLLVAKLKALAVEYPHDASWLYYIGQLYAFHHQYEDAIDTFNEALEIDVHPTLYEMIAECYGELGNYSEAIQAINKAIDLDPYDTELTFTRADLLGAKGDIDGAIAGWSAVIEKNPDWAYAYYRRGFFEDNSAQTDKALADYEMSIMLEPDHAYSYLGKGDMLIRKGEGEKAMEAYRKVVELDTVPYNSSCAMYAFLALGEKDQAIDFMDKVIAQDSINAGNYYDAACLYSRMGDLEKSMAYLLQAVEKGFSRFHHIMADDDLNALRETEDFKEFYKEYKDKFEPQSITEITIVDENGNGFSTKVLSRADIIEVPFTPEHGCASVKCSINELPLTFVFDTGASTVSISQLEANFMLKNGYLKREDFVGTSRFVDANGDVSEGTIINLREVEFGGLKLSNVKASVVRNQKAPLLLGQSVLGRLGSIEIDNPNRKLIITSGHSD